MSLWDNFTSYFSDFSFGKVADSAGGFLGNIFEPEMTASREYTPYKSSQSYVGGSQKFPPQKRTYMGAGKGYQYFDQRGASLKHSSAGRYLNRQTQTSPYTRGSSYLRGTPFEYPAAVLGGVGSTLRDVVNDYIIDPITDFTSSRTANTIKDKTLEGAGNYAEMYAKAQMNKRSAPTDRFRLGAGGAGNRINRFTKQGSDGTAAQFVSGKTGISDTLMNVLRNKIQDADVLPRSDLSMLQFYLEKQQSQGVFTSLRDTPGIKTTLSRPPVTTTVSS
jgi:hypothetical protein